MTRTPVLVLAAGVLALAACGSPSAATGTGDGYPVTVTNCGAEVTFDAPPQRVVLLKSASVSYLHDLGVLDRVVARAGRYPHAYYDDTTRDELAGIPVLTDAIDTAGHVQISREVVIAQRPDLVLGAAAGADRDALAAAGIPLLEEPALCPDGPPAVDYGDIDDQFALYGRVFGVPEQAEAAAVALQERLDAQLDRADPAERRTAAVLYPTLGGGVTYAYGNSGMAQAQLAAAGLTNVFADVDDRVFEVTREELIARDPDVLVLLHEDGDPEQVRAAVTGLPGAEGITAVRDDAILVHLFNFTEPPSPLTVDGLVHLLDLIEAGP